MQADKTRRVKWQYSKNVGKLKEIIKLVRCKASIESGKIEEGIAAIIRE